MKRGINQLDWTYMCVTMCNEMPMIFVGREGIIVSERHQSYKVLVEFVCDNSSRFRSETHILESDGVVDQHILTNVFGLPNAHLIADHWHLLNVH